MRSQPRPPTSSWQSDRRSARRTTRWTPRYAQGSKRQARPSGSWRGGSCRDGATATGSSTDGSRRSISSRTPACPAPRFMPRASARRRIRNSALTGATAKAPDGSRRPSALASASIGRVHRGVREAIGVRVHRAADVLEGNAADFVRQRARPRVQRLQSGVLHLVVADHLLNEQLRIRPDMQLVAAVPLRPVERGEQAAVLGDVIRRDADRFGEFFDERPVALLDTDAEAGRAGVATRTAVDVRDHRLRRGIVEREHLRGLRRGIDRGCRRRHVIENPVAVVALQDRFVAADGVEHLRPQADVADGADAVLRFGDGDAVSLLRDLLEGEEHLRIERADERGPLLAHLLERLLQLAVVRLHRLAVGVDGLLFGGELGFGLLHGGREVVGFEHPLEHRVLVLLDLGLGVRDLVLDRVVLLVRLDGHRLLAELRQPALVDGDLFLGRAPGVLVLGEEILRGGEALTGGLETRVERLVALRLVGELFPRRFGGGIETLQRDQPFEVSMHGGPIVHAAVRRSSPEVPLSTARTVADLKCVRVHRRVGLPTVARAHVGKRERRWAHQDLNLEPADYEPAALTIELWARESIADCALARSAFQERAQFARPRRMAQLAQRLRFDLANPFARDREALTDFLERVLAAVADAEPHLDHLLLTRRQRLEDRLGLLLQVQVDHRFGRRDHLAILDEVAKMRIFLFADRRLERDRLLRDLQHLADLGHRNVHPLGDLFGGRLATELLDQRAGGANQLVDRLDHVDRDADRARLVGDGASDRLADPPRRIGRELVAAAVLELVDRLHQADVAFLNQIEELQAAIGVLLRDRDDEAEVGFDELLLRHLGFVLAVEDDVERLLQLVRRLLQRV